MRVTDVFPILLTSILNIICILKINHKLKPEAESSKGEVQRVHWKLKRKAERWKVGGERAWRQASVQAEKTESVKTEFKTDFDIEITA